MVEASFFATALLLFVEVAAAFFTESISLLELGFALGVVAPAVELFFKWARICLASLSLMELL